MEKHPKKFAILVAGGTGVRFGGYKQLQDLAGLTVLERSLRIVAQACEKVVVVLPPELLEELRPELAGQGFLVTSGGKTRSDSVRCGLSRLLDEEQDAPASDSVIIVHDAARPLASPELFSKTIVAIQDGADAAVPTLPLTDSIRHIVEGPKDRTKLRAVQTPQAFRAKALLDAHASQPEATDDACLVEAMGGRVVLVDGEENNLKITKPRDLAVANALLEI